MPVYFIVSYSTGDADGETSTEYADKGKHIGVQKETGEATGDKESETDSGMSEEDLSALMGDDGQWLQPEHSGMLADECINSLTVCIHARYF